MVPSSVHNAFYLVTMRRKISELEATVKDIDRKAVIWRRSSAGIGVALAVASLFLPVVDWGRYLVWGALLCVGFICWASVEYFTGRRFVALLVQEQLTEIIATLERLEP